MKENANILIIDDEVQIRRLLEISLSTHGFGVLTNIAALIGARSPLLFFGVPGLALLALGVVVDTWAVARFSATAQVPVLVSVVGGLLTVVGLLLIGAAIVLKSLSMLLRHRR